MGYKMSLPTSSSDISYTLGKAIPLCHLSGIRLPSKCIYDMIENLVILYGEIYACQDAVIKGAFINIYYEYSDSTKSLNFPNISDMIGKIVKIIDSNILGGNLPEVKSLMGESSRIPLKITKIRDDNIRECRPFIVAETVMVNDVHVPYAAGYLVVKPGDDLTSIPSYSTQTFFSENYIPFYTNF